MSKGEELAPGQGRGVLDLGLEGVPDRGLENIPDRSLDGVQDRGLAREGQDDLDLRRESLPKEVAEKRA